MICELENVRVLPGIVGFNQYERSTIIFIVYFIVELEEECINKITFVPFER